jgi:hypothetical protein
MKLKKKLEKYTIGRSKEIEIPDDNTFPKDVNFVKVFCGEFVKDKYYAKQSLYKALKYKEN